MPNFFTLPGDYALHMLTLHAPGMASLLGIAKPEDSIVLTIVLSAIMWVLACVLFWGFYKLVQNIYRITGAFVRIVWFRAMQAIGSVKTWVVCKSRQLVPRRRIGNQHDERPDVQLDNFDITVMQAAADCVDGAAASAPELANTYGLRSSQFQHSLDKLHSSKMITAMMSSTGKFDTYSLTDYGAAYMKMWEQRQAG